MKASFGPNLDVLDLRKAVLEGGKKRRIDRQFLLLMKLPSDAPRQLAQGNIVRGLVKLHRGVKRFEQLQVAHVAEKYRPTRPQRSVDDLLEHRQQIMHAGEVLYDRRKQHGVETLVLETLHVVRRFPQQPGLFKSRESLAK